MKKLFLSIVCLVLCVCMAAGFSACSDDDGAFSVYVPDGAPALSVASLCADRQDSPFAVDVVKAETIKTYVTGADPEADFALLPVNTAVQLLGSGEKYKMLGTVTHGNLFLIKKDGGENIEPSNLSRLVGKTVGVINLANVPGLTFKVILNDKNLEYNELRDGSSVSLDKVNLKNISATEAIPTNADCDYFVVPEPAASTKIGATGGKLSFAGSLQSLYGGESGYPQAVAVVKTKIYDGYPKMCDKFKASFIATDIYLNDGETSSQQIASAVQSCMKGDMTPTFTAQNLTKTVIENCNIKFVKAADCKTEILTFMEKLNAVSGNSWGTPSDGFFA